ncbi:hypothetical protein GCM10027075_06970 [Streptomyces heilongjiangensis]
MAIDRFSGVWNPYRHGMPEGSQRMVQGRSGPRKGTALSVPFPRTSRNSRQDPPARAVTPGNARQTPAVGGVGAALQQRHRVNVTAVRPPALPFPPIEHGRRRT